MPSQAEALRENPQQRASHPEHNIWLAASAGTGKTKVLTDRVLRLLLGGTTPGNILCLTFTKAAAAEMQHRINRELARWAAEPDAALDKRLRSLTGGEADERTRQRARGLFLTVLDDPAGLRIQTIHSFCQSVLQRFPLEADVAPNFTLLDDAEAAQYHFRAMQNLLMRDAATPGGAAVAELLGELLSGEWGFRDVMQKLLGLRGRLCWRDGLEAEAALDHLAEQLEIPPGEDADSVLAAACADMPWIGDLRSLCAMWLRQEEKSYGHKAARSMVDWLAAGPADRPALWPVYAEAMATDKGTLNSRLFLKAVKESHPHFEGVVEREFARIRAVQDRLSALELLRRSRVLNRVAQQLYADYEALKAADSALDFEDILQKTHHLLTESELAAWVLFRLDGGIEHLLVDEAQDTSDLQWAIVRRLTEEFHTAEAAENLRTLFVVGDQKQAIYGFQGASPAAFRLMEGYYAEKIRPMAAIGHRFESVPMGLSYRSTPPVLKLVDAVFQGREEALGGESRHHWHKAGHGGVVELWPLLPRPAVSQAWQPWRDYPAQGEGAGMADQVAEMIQDWLRHGRMLESAGRAVRPGDIMILLRKRDELMPALQQALARRGIPVAGVDRFALLEDIAVQDLLALGDWLLLPEDDYSLACILKSPLVGPVTGLTEDELFRLAHGRDGQSLWSRLKHSAGDSASLTHAATFLEDCRRHAAERTPWEFYYHLLEKDGARQSFIARMSPAVEPALAGFLQLLEQFEQRHAPLWQSALAWLRRSGGTLKREMEGGRDEVRIMTVHGAKGLQAPLVILPDTTGRGRDEPPPFIWTSPEGDSLLLWPTQAGRDGPFAVAIRQAIKDDRERESQRLLYVALTRAEEALVILGQQTGRQENASEKSWYAAIEQGFAALDGVEELPVPAGWPGEGGAVIRRYREAQQAERKTAAGITRPSMPPLDTAWLEQPVPPEAGPEWVTPSARMEAHFEPPPVAAGEGGLVMTAKDRGVLIHQLLQFLPMLPEPERRSRAEAYLRWQSIPEEMRPALISEVLAVLAMPELQPFWSGNALAELPLAGALDGKAVFGQIDRLLVTESEVLILDFKTGHVPERLPAHYHEQMRWYARLLQPLYPGRNIRSGIVWTALPRLDWLD